MNNLQFIKNRYGVKNSGWATVSKTHEILTKPVSKLPTTEDPKRVTNFSTSSDDFNVKNFEILATSTTPNEPINEDGIGFVTSKKLVEKNDLQFIRSSLNVKNARPATLIKSSIVNIELFTNDEPKSKSTFPSKSVRFNSEMVKNNEPQFSSRNLDAKNSESTTVSKAITTSTVLSTISTELPNAETAIDSTTFTPSSDAIINDENTGLLLSEELVNSSDSQSIRPLGIFGSKTSEITTVSGPVSKNYSQMSSRNISKTSTIPITSTMVTQLGSPPRIQARTGPEQSRTKTIFKMAGFNFNSKNSATNIKFLNTIPTFNYFYVENLEKTTASKAVRASFSPPKSKENSEFTERAKKINHLEFISDNIKIVSSGFATFTSPNKLSGTTNDKEALGGSNKALEIKTIKENTDLLTTVESTNTNNKFNVRSLETMTDQTQSTILTKLRTAINNGAFTTVIAAINGPGYEADSKLFASEIATVQSDVNNYNLKEVEVITNEENNVYQQKSPELLTVNINDLKFIRNTFNTSNESINLKTTENANRIIATEETQKNLRSISDIKNLEISTISTTPPPAISSFTTSNGSNSMQYNAEKFDLSSLNTTMPAVLDHEIIMTDKTINNNDIQHNDNTHNIDHLEAVTIPPSLTTSNQLITTPHFKDNNKLRISEELTNKGLQSINNLVTEIFFKNVSGSNQSATQDKTTNMLNKSKNNNKLLNVLKPSHYNSMQLNLNSSDITNKDMVTRSTTFGSLNKPLKLDIGDRLLITKKNNNNLQSPGISRIVFDSNPLETATLSIAIRSAITKNPTINNGLYSVSNKLATNSLKPVRMSTTSTTSNVSTKKLFSKTNSKVSTSKKSMTSNDLQSDSYSFVTNNIESATIKPANVLQNIVNNEDISTRTDLDSAISTTYSKNLGSTSLFESNTNSTNLKVMSFETSTISNYNNNKLSGHTSYVNNLKPEADSTDNIIKATPYLNYFLKKTINIENSNIYATKKSTLNNLTDTKNDSESDTIGKSDKFPDYQAIISTILDIEKNNTHGKTDEEINNNRTIEIIIENLDHQVSTVTISDVEINNTHVKSDEETYNNRIKETIVENANYQDTAGTISDMENKNTHHKNQERINNNSPTETPDYQTVLWIDNENNDGTNKSIAENLHHTSTTLNMFDVENETTHDEHNDEINNKKTTETVAENPGYQAIAATISDIENKNDHPNNNKTAETTAETPTYQAVIWTILDIEHNNTDNENYETININKTKKAIAENKTTHKEHKKEINNKKITETQTIAENPDYQVTTLNIFDTDNYNTEYEYEDKIKNYRIKPVEENQDYQVLIWTISNIENNNSHRENDKKTNNNRPTETITEKLQQQAATLNISDMKNTNTHSETDEKITNNRTTEAIDENPDHRAIIWTIWDMEKSNNIFNEDDGKINNDKTAQTTAKMPAITSTIPNMKTNNINDEYDEEVKATIVENPDYQTRISTIFDMDNNNARDENNQIKLPTAVKHETISIPFGIDLQDIEISTHSSSTKNTSFYQYKSEESQINDNQNKMNTTDLEALEITNALQSGWFNSIDNNKSEIETTTIDSISLEEYLTSLASSNLNFQRNTPVELTNFSKNKTGLSKEIQNFVENLVETTTAPWTMLFPDLELKTNNTAAESNIFRLSNANTENFQIFTNNLDYSYNTEKDSEGLSNFGTTSNLYPANDIQTTTSSEDSEEYEKFIERLNMLMNNIEKNNIDSCNHFNQYACKNQSNVEYKFEMFDRILKAITQNGLKSERFKQFYESCSTYNGTTKIQMKDTINLKFKAIQDKLKSIISEMILSQTMYFFDIKVKIGKRKKFQFEFGLPEHNVLDNWTMISKFRKICVGDTDNNTGNAEALDMFKDCVYNETMKYVMGYPHKGKQAEAEYNIAKITEMLDLQKQYDLTDASEEEFSVKDLYEQFDFGLSWKLLLQELSQATITNKTVVVFQNNVYIKKLFEKFQSLRKNSLKEVLYLWHRMHLDGYYFETVQDRKYYCVEKATHLLPRETIQILNFISNDATVKQNVVSPTEINNIFQDLKYTLKKFITQCRLNGVQSWTLQKRLKHMELYFSGNAPNNTNVNHHALLARDFPNQVLEVVRSYKKDVYSLINQKVTPTFLSNYFLNPLNTKPKSFFPINYIVYHPGYFLDIPKNLSPFMKLAVLGLPLSEEILKSFYYKDFLTRKLKCFFTSIKINQNINKTQTFTLHSWRKEKSYELLLDIYKNKPYLDNNSVLTNFSSDQLFVLSSMQTYCKQEHSKSLLINIDKQFETAQLLQDSTFFKNTFNCSNH